MDLINENENLIHCLQELRDELKIEELEKAIRNQELRLPIPKMGFAP